MQRFLLTVSLLFGLILGSCGTPAPSPTTGPAPRRAVLTTETASPLAAETPTLAAAEGGTPTPTADLSAFAQTDLKTGDGFSVQIPKGLIVTRPEGGISALGKGYLFGFFFRDFEGQALLEDAVAKFFDELAARDFELQHGDPYKVSVQGRDGLAADFTGKIGKEPVAGEVLVFSPTQGKVFLGLGMVTTDPAEQNWAQTGRALFQQILGTVTFGP